MLPKSATGWSIRADDNKLARCRQGLTVERDELALWLRLTLSDGIGNTIGRKLLAAFGLPGIFKQGAMALAQLVSPAQVAALQVEPAGLGELLDRSWRWLQESTQDGVQRSIWTLGDANYPSSLLQVDEPPLMLYVLGQPDLLTTQHRPAIAVVGSRNPTVQGALNARAFAKSLAQAGLVVVSGLALGIDAAAHQGALDAVSGTEPTLATIAVVGTGLDRVYPGKNIDLAHHIAKNGLLLSEYLLGTPPLAANFPRRNRLIAGLAQATLVVEAALRSGSLITARFSADQGKDVFAIPGSIHSPQARGCHALIRQGAKLVETVQDVLEELNLAARSASDSALVASDDADQCFADTDQATTALLHQLGFDPVGLDALQARSGLAAASLQSLLLRLELEGLVARLPGGLFQRLVKT